jgi:hypothetical protein
MAAAFIVMSYNSMIQRLCLEVPGLASAYAGTLLNEALTTIYGEQYWSWQVKTGEWLTPGLLFPSGGVGPTQSTGTIAAVPYQSTVVGNSVASAQWLPYIAGASLPFFTQLQIRSPFYSIYNIISVNATNPNAIVLTLDRPWTDPGGSALTYMIYQAYFPVPVTTNDFKRFRAAVDITNNNPLDYWSYSQQDLAILDPQRTNFSSSLYIVPWQVDQRVGSATIGNMLYELWPQQLSVLPYAFQYLRMGPSLVNPTDTVPYPLTEKALLWKAKECGFLYKESQKGEDMQRGSGANWQFLAEVSEVKYKKSIKPVKDIDADLMPLYWNTFVRDVFAATTEPFATTTGSLNVGRF